MSVLITGFGPFDGGSNASGRLVEALRRRRVAERLGIEAAFAVLPVDTERAPDLLDRAIRGGRPTHVLLTGQAAGRSRVTLERFAINLRDFGATPEESGHRGGAVLEGGPLARRASWPDLAGAAAALERAGIPAAVSHHAGTHLCNQMLYHALGVAEAGNHGYVAGFMHLPILPEQVIRGEPAAQRHRDCAFLPLDMAVKAVEILLGRVLAPPGA